jgi:hypothetical protein
MDVFLQKLLPILTVSAPFLILCIVASELPVAEATRFFTVSVGNFKSSLDSLNENLGNFGYNITAFAGNGRSGFDSRI